VPHARIARSRLLALLKQFPCVAILGPRQAGKSTLARIALPRFHVLDLENPIDHDRLARDPLFALAEHEQLVIDEAQRVPQLFPVLRTLIDRHPRRRFVLLGSASPALLRQISESLSGRVGFLQLAGISLFEEQPEAVWIRGGFPRVHWSRPRATPEDWYPAYLRTCLEQDIPQLGFRVSSLRMRKLLTMLAHAQGGLSNLSELGGSLGISYHSVAHLLDIFEGVFLVRRLQPYHANVGKRLVKSPRIYVRDTGLMHSLLGISFDKHKLLAHPKVGASFETFCIEQLAMHAELADPRAQVHFYRTHTGQEVDLILELRGRLVPIEIKLGLTPPDTRGLEASMHDLGLEHGYVVNLSAAPIKLRSNVTMCGLPHLLERLELAPKRFAATRGSRVTAPRS
jgi:predicted AAA+ superfamily ATPase